MTLRAVDLSHVKTITSWDALCGYADIVILKATEGSPEGTSFLDPLFASRLAELRRRGKLTGVYHYVGSSSAKRVYSAASEADWFATNYGWRPGEVPIADYEPTVPPADPDGWLAAFLQRLTAKGWPLPLAYMNDGTARSNAWAATRGLDPGLWVARYFANNGLVPTSQPSVGPWGGWAMWQYTSNGTVPGVSGPTDVSLFYGTADQWRAYGTPNGADMTTVDLTPASVQAVVQALLNQPVTRAGGPTGVTNLAATVAWLDANFDDLRAKVAAVKADPTAIANVIVGQLPAADAQKVAQLVLAGLNGASLNVTAAS